MIVTSLVTPGLLMSSSTACTFTFWRWSQLSVVNAKHADWFYVGGVELLTVSAPVSELDTDTVTVSVGREARLTQ